MEHTKQTNGAILRIDDKRMSLPDLDLATIRDVYENLHLAAREPGTWTTDLKDRRIRANVVSPGPINTPWMNRQSPDVIARIVSTVPMGRMGGA